jgi:hypothetical protein
MESSSNSIRITVTVTVNTLRSTSTSQLGHFSDKPEVALLATDESSECKFSVKIQPSTGRLEGLPSA